MTMFAPEPEWLRVMDVTSVLALNSFTKSSANGWCACIVSESRRLVRRRDMHEDPGITETDMSWALEGEVDGDDEDVLGLPLDYIPWKER